MPRKSQPARLYLRSDDERWLILDQGKQHSTGFRGDQKDEAEAALAEYIRKRARQRSGPVSANEILIGEIIESYVEGRAEDIKARERLRYAIEALGPFWAERKASDVNRKTCREYERSRPVAPSTVRRELGVLRTALRWAHNDGLLTEEVKVPLPPHGKPKERCLTKEEVDRLMEVSPPHLQRFIHIAVVTGRRKAAILGLRWTKSAYGGHVDLTGNRIHFLGTEETESKKRRGHVPIRGQLHERLSEWKQDGHEHVITYRGKPVRDIKTAFAKAVKAAGLGDDVTPHTLKHTAVSWAAQHGMSMFDATHYFQTSQQTLERVYQHHSPDHLRSAAEAMDRHFSQAAGSPIPIPEVAPEDQEAAISALEGA